MHCQHVSCATILLWFMDYGLSLVYSVVVKTCLSIWTAISLSRCDHLAGVSLQCCDRNKSEYFNCYFSEHMRLFSQCWFADHSNDFMEYVFKWVWLMVNIEGFVSNFELIRVRAIFELKFRVISYCLKILKWLWYILLFARRNIWP